MFPANQYSDASKLVIYDFALLKSKKTQKKPNKISRNPKKYKSKSFLIVNKFQSSITLSSSKSYRTPHLDMKIYAFSET